MILRHGVRRQSRRVASLVVAVLAATTLAGPASAQEDIDERENAQLLQQLETATRGVLDAKNKLSASEKRQKKLVKELEEIEEETEERSAVMAEVAEQAYRGGRIGAASALLTSDSSNFLRRMATLDIVAADQNEKVQALLRSRAKADKAREALAKEITEQKRQVEVMEARKRQAGQALAAANVGGEEADGPDDSGGGGGATASRAPRRGDGSFAPQSCSSDDPTTGGCLTPRTLNALRSAKNDGFTRFVRCFRSGGGGEHPKGRACDFAAQRNGFGGVASGGDKRYGDNLANYFIRNADRLGVLYVIWFKRIYLVGIGWRAYNNGNGDPSSDHTNHVHLSMV